MMKNGAHECTVQFGATGKGIAPHYMITDKEGKKHMFSGLNHDPYKGISADHFAEEKLSPTLGKIDIQQEIKKRYNPKTPQ
tara:strand:+ start:1974 stop:2216 length:243 start_codon:yes stop_codon:yes gene_type:complete